MEKLYKVQMNSKGMPNFSTAVEIEDIPIYGNEHNCIMTIFGECSYAETGCGDCAVVEKVRKALSTDRPQGEWTDIYQLSTDGRMTAQCKNCREKIIFRDKTPNYCPNCGAKMKGADDE